MRAMEKLATGRVRFVKQERVKDDAHFQAVSARAREEAWEGIIVRKDGPYVAKRVYVVAPFTVLRRMGS